MAKILIIDDEQMVRASIRILLENEGHQVFEAANGLEANNNIIRKQTLDLIITDILMPVQDGFETIAAIKTLYPEIPIIAISGWGRNEDTAQNILDTAGRLGVDACLRKPFSNETFLDTVNTSLGSGGD